MFPPGWTGRSGTSMAASSRTGRARRKSSRWSPAAWSNTAGFAGGRWPAPMHAAATASRSRPIWAKGRASTGRCSTSPVPTPSRTSATTKRCARPSNRAGWLHRRGSEERSGRRGLLLGLLEFPLEGVAVGLDFLLERLVRPRECLVELLLQPGLADHDEGRLTTFELVP